ncbi:MAG: hypothetical protein NBV67_07300 [Tagaea sp.]|nr:hypothetical protein [Tagaea sp.]
MKGSFPALVAFLFACVFCIGPARADLPGERVPWQTLGALTPADRALARAWANESFPAPEPGGVDWRARARAAVVKLPEGGDLLFVRLPMLGNCGTMDPRIYGPRAARGGRPTLIDGLCVSGFNLAWREGQRLPDLIEGRSDLIAVIHRADGDGWGATETVENIVRRRDPNELGSERGPFGHLVRHVGTYDAPAVLADPTVGPIIRASLGPHFVTLLTNLAVRVPIEFVDGCVVVAGLAAHSGGAQEALLAVCARGSVHAALLTDEGKTWRLFSRATDWREVPRPVREFFDRRRAEMAPPEGLRWSRAAEWLGD